MAEHRNFDAANIMADHQTFPTATITAEHQTFEVTNINMLVVSESFTFSR